jgi:hypothetical protein
MQVEGSRRRAAGASRYDTGSCVKRLIKHTRHWLTSVQNTAHPVQISHAESGTGPDSVYSTAASIRFNLRRPLLEPDRCARLRIIWQFAQYETWIGID